MLPRVFHDQEVIIPIIVAAFLVFNLVFEAQGIYQPHIIEYVPTIQIILTYLSDVESKPPFVTDGSLQWGSSYFLNQAG